MEDCSLYFPTVQFFYAAFCLLHGSLPFLADAAVARAIPLDTPFASAQPNPALLLLLLRMRLCRTFSEVTLLATHAALRWIFFFHSRLGFSRVSQPRHGWTWCSACSLYR